jgi:hypothetical protein
MNYETRIVKIGVAYFLEYKAKGFFWALLHDSPFWWERYSNVPCPTVEEAKKEQHMALNGYRLNRHSPKVVE